VKLVNIEIYINLYFKVCFELSVGTILLTTVSNLMLFYMSPFVKKHIILESFPKLVWVQAFKRVGLQRDY